MEWGKLNLPKIKRKKKKPRISLSIVDFENLVKGEIIHLPEAHIALQDIGFYQMREAIQKAVNETVQERH